MNRQVLISRKHVPLWSEIATDAEAGSRCGFPLEMLMKRCRDVKMVLVNESGCNDFAGHSDNPSMLQFPKHIDRVAQLIHYSEMSHRVISHNLANVNTPNYTRLTLDFEAALRSNGEVSSNSKPSVIEDHGRPVRMDGNNVDIDQELGQLNRNSLMFETYSQILMTHLSTMRLALGRS